MLAVLLILGAIGVFALAIFLASYAEARRYNNGKCVKCGNELKYFDSDSQGGRGYKCSNCGHTVWVSYPWVDR